MKIASVAMFVVVVVPGRIECAMAVAVRPIWNLSVNRSDLQPGDPNGKGDRRQ